MSVGPVRESTLSIPAPIADVTHSTPTSAVSPPATAREGPSAFGQLLRGLGHEVQHGESLVQGAVASASGGALSPASLIALQAGVYRYSEVVDLAARLVDHATTAVKTVVQNQ
jgi:hypothetical protein